jgi:hypothetical protein
VIGELLARAQRRIDAVALAFEVGRADALLDAAREHVRDAAAVAELRLLAPQDLVRKPPAEGASQQALLELAWR